MVRSHIVPDSVIRHPVSCQVSVFVFWFERSAIETIASILSVRLCR